VPFALLGNWRLQPLNTLNTGVDKAACAYIKYHLQSNHIWKLTLVADGANPNRSMYIRPGLNIQLGFRSKVGESISMKCWEILKWLGRLSLVDCHAGWSPIQPIRFVETNSPSRVPIWSDLLYDNATSRNETHCLHISLFTDESCI
jgi:hypothetical protein